MDENQMNQMEMGMDSQTTFGMNVNGTLETPPKKKKTGFVIAGIIVVLLLLLGAGAFGMLKYREQQDMDAGGEMIAAFMKAYGRLHLEDAYETFHPDVRDGVIEEQLDTYMMSGLTGLERYLDLYFGDMELTYEINNSKRLSEEELEDLLSEIDDSYDADLEIDKVYAYQVTEVFSGDNGTLKVRDNYFVGKDEDDWYIIAVITDKIIKNDVSFSITDYLTTELIDEFMVLYSEAINECDSEKMEDAYGLMHPEIRDVFIEQWVLLNGVEDMGEFVEQRNSLYGGFSSEYEILEITYLKEREWNSILRQVEDYFGTKFDFGMRGVWQFDLKETFSGNNGTVVMVENYFLGEEDGKWYIIDINSEEVISDTLYVQPVYTGDEGYASVEEAIEHYMHAYEDFDVEEAFMAFHPVIREFALAKACYNDGVDDAEEYNEMLNSLFGGSLTVTYTITTKADLSESELGAFSYFFWGSEEPPANISDACMCLLEEHYEGGGAALDVGELIMAGKDGGQWFLYNSTIIPEDLDLDAFDF